MDSLPISSLPELRFLDSRGSEIESPKEWEPALAEVPGQVGRWQEVRVWRHDVSLPVVLRHIGGQARVVAEWPRSAVGQYRLQVNIGELGNIRDVEVWPQKITREEFVQLVKDLESRLPISLAMALQRAGGLTGVDLPAPEMTSIEQEMERLRRAITGTDKGPGLDKILAELGRDPHQVLRSIEVWIRREQARRPHPARLLQAYARGQNLDRHGQPMKVVDTRVDHMVDVYENRLVRTYHDLVARRLRRLRWVAAVTGLGSLLEEAKVLEEKLRRARRQADFLDQVRALDHPPKQLTMVLLQRPAYRAALEGYLMFNKSIIVQLNEPAMESPLSNLPHLYQVWGTLEVIGVLLEVGRELGYRVEEERLIRPDRSGFYVLAMNNGETALKLRRQEDGTVVTLTPERSYSRSSGTLRSISYTQRPDVTVEIELADGSRRAYLFDPKYKLISEMLTTIGGASKGALGALAGENANDVDDELAEAEGEAGASATMNQHARPKKVDIDKMHAYRDSIRDLENKRVVQYAAVLYPGPNVRYGKGEKIGIEALQALPLSKETLEADLRQILSGALRGPNTDSLRFDGLYSPPER